MPSRNRWTRLLVGVVVFVVVVVLYTRRAPVEAYRDYVSEKVIGGGAVMRGKPGLNPATSKPVQQTKSEVILPHTSIPVPERATSSASLPKLPTQVDTTSTLATSSAEAAKTLSVGAPIAHNGLPAITYDDEIPAEGRVEMDGIPQASTASLIHWTKFLEKFPVSTTIQLPTGSPLPQPRIQYSGKDMGKADSERLAIIRAATEHAWNGYREVAWAADEVRPLSGKSNNPFNGWGATLVDSLDTLWILGMKEEFEEAVEAVRKIDFTTSIRADIPLFETTIRYLGGLIAAYDVSNGKYRILLDKAVELAEVLYASFDTPNRMPLTYYRWKPAFASQPHRATGRVVLAELGSLSLEFTRLAQLTGEPKYYDAIARITNAFEDWQNNTRLPGMWPTSIDASGCQKPVQLANLAKGQEQLIPGGNGEVMHAADPIQATAKSDSAHTPDKHTPSQKTPLDDMRESVAQGEPGRGKIVGFGDPIKEGSLDTKESKAEVLSNGFGSSKHKRQLNALPSEADRQAADTRHDQSVPRAPAAAEQPLGQEACIPQGLGSSSPHGQESFTLGGMSDSTYEYLPKQYLLLGGLVDQYRSVYEASADTAIENLIFRPMTIDERDILIAGSLKISVNLSDNTYIRKFAPESEHLTCFAGGMFAMGGKIFERPLDVEIGRKLTDGCVWAYNATATGIMPEIFTAVQCDSVKSCAWNETEYWHQLDPYEATRTKVPTVKANVPPISTADYSSAPATSTVAVGKILDKRQLGEAAIDEPKPARPAPAQAPSAQAVEVDIAGQHQPAAPLPQLPAPPPAAWTPKPPLPHAEFVAKKIEDERLPPGFVKIPARKYILRPEAIESVFYMYRITGEQYWRDVGWQMFMSIDQHTRALYGNAAIDDVTKSAPEQRDTMESFWTAETLKYFYLLFDDIDSYSLDDWVLNTEAHFFKRPKGGFVD